MLDLLLDEILLDVLLLPLEHQLYFRMDRFRRQMLAASQATHAAIGLDLTPIIGVILRHAIIMGLGEEIKALRFRAFFLFLLLEAVIGDSLLKFIVEIKLHALIFALHIRIPLVKLGRWQLLLRVVISLE